MNWAMKFLMMAFGLFAFISASHALTLEQKIHKLEARDVTALQKQRAVIERFLDDAELKGKYLTAAGKLGTLQALLQKKVFKAQQTRELQSMGVVLGDAFVKDMGFEWVIVKDEVGHDPALRYKKTGILLFPLTMISKRVERGEDVDVFDLYNGVSEEVLKAIDEVGAEKP
jgi:hypothetical protein